MVTGFLRNLVALGSLCVLLLVVGQTYADRKLASSLAANGSYYLITLLVVIVVWQLWLFGKSLKIQWASMLKRYRFSVGIALGVVLVLLLSVPTAFRTFADETILVSMSKSMYYDHTIWNVLTGKYFDEAFHPIEKVLPKRPLLFPYVIHLVHQILGYSAYNGFWVNAFAGLLIFAVVAAAVERKAGRVAALGAVLLVASHPVVALSVRSSGFDLFASAATLILMVVTWLHIRQPTVESACAVWVSLVMTASTRYECLLYFPLILGLCVWFRKETIVLLRQRLWLVSLSLWCMVPFYWQMLLADRKVHTNNTDVEQLFALDHFWKHVQDLVKLHADMPFVSGYSLVVNVVGFISLIWLVLQWWGVKGKAQVGAETVISMSRVALLLVGITLVHQLVLLSFWSGWPDHPSTSRYFLNGLIILSVAPVLLYCSLVKERRVPLLVASAVAFVMYHPQGADATFIKPLAVNREIYHTYKFIEEYIDDPRALLINERPVAFSVLNIGSINFGYLRRNIKDIQREFVNHVYREVFVVQIMNSGTNESLVKQKLPPEIKLEHLYSLRYTPGYYLRFSRVVSIAPITRTTKPTKAQLEMERKEEEQRPVGF